jgi:signal transduction histidine kinase
LNARVDIQAGGAPPHLSASGRRDGLPRGGMRISTRLCIIIAICLLPIIGLQVAVSWSQWTERKAQLGALAVRQAELLAGNMDSITEGARILLGAAAEFNRAGMLDEGCGQRLAALQQRAAGFAFVALVDTAGRIRCASDPALIGRDSADWARPPDGTREFTAGRFTRLPDWPGGVLPFHEPVAGTGAQPGDMLVAALDLSWLEQHLIGLKRAGSPFLANGVLTIADADGVILARDARHAEFVGKAFPPQAMVMLRATEPGILRLRSIDGTERVVGYVPPGPASRNLAAAVGFHEPELMADIERAVLHGTLLLAAVSAAVFGLTLLVARRFIANPTHALLATARRWREGDLAARAQEEGQGPEFRQIATAFNEMAAALKRREAELRSHAETQETRVVERTRELVQANEKLRQEIAERRHAEAALLQAQKVQAVGQLAGGIAHDFNNILQAVLGGASLIRRRAGNAEAVTGLAGMIQDAAQRGQSVTRRLLAFSRREELRAGRHDLGELLPSLREVLGATLGARYRVEALVEPDLPPVFADRGQLETVLVNLATNARDAMPGGGTLTFSAELRRVEDGMAGLAAGDYIRLVAADTGEGMAAETLARATEPFFTTKPLGQGTGLGLAMARSFAEGSSGKLCIASEPGRGTQVTLWLPVAHAPAPQDAAPEPMGAARPRGRGLPCHVLLVDDDEVVRQILAQELADEGCAVTQAADGAAALTILDGGAGIDILVSDLAMPGIDGVALIREVRRRWPELPAVLITGYAGDAAALAAGQGSPGSFMLVRKPVTGTRLAERIGAFLEGSRRETVRAG